MDSVSKETLCNSYRKEIKDLQELLLVYVRNVPVNNYDLQMRGRSISLTLYEIDKIKEKLVNTCFKR